MKNSMFRGLIALSFVLCLSSVAFASSVYIEVVPGITGDPLDEGAIDLTFSISVDGVDASFNDGNDYLLEYEWEMDYMSDWAVLSGSLTSVDFSQYIYGHTWVLTILDDFDWSQITGWDDWSLAAFIITDDLGNTFSYDVDNNPVAITNVGLTTFSITTPAAPVPEPSTFVLFGAGLLGLGYFRRNKK